MNDVHKFIQKKLRLVHSLELFLYRPKVLKGQIQKILCDEPKLKCQTNKKEPRKKYL
jgi:hypothetical protein